MQKKLAQNFNYKLRIGVEIEFYLEPQDIQQKLYAYLQAYNLKKERGCHQYEIEISPTEDLTYLAQLINDIITKIQLLAQLYNGISKFDAKPYLFDYGNALHFHIELLDYNNSNIFEQDCNILTLIINSICHYMKETFLVFVHREADFLRLNKNFMAPTHISYGGNNRTVAIRIPNSFPLRIEHRLASPLICHYLALYTILRSIYLGINMPQTINHYVKVYGNAYDSQYNLEPLPTDLITATQCFNIEFFKI
ncbi:glutamine synthetase, catalytic domain protein [Orientia chuto str. Dubai]|uniref:Glutamine synthetase, catalytic domain protein n=1 Tax=Orientia chuto str. Dubai TaxID=1359168 RepID=A0A0F3MN54_9RICK|nr:glutamine synthetase, catalytic domain protein [Orientia chuto str. Dubai]